MPEATVGPLRWRARLDVITSIVLIVASVILVWPRLVAVFRAESGAPFPLPSTPIPLAGTARLGNPTASVAMVVFSDFECPFCAAFANEILPVLRTQYVDPGLLQLSFRHLPLTTLHPLALRAANASACANEQGHFWIFHDKLFKVPTRIDDDALALVVRGIPLDHLRYAGCLKAGPAAVTLDIELAEQLKIHGTPAFLFGQVSEDAVRVSEVMAGVVDIERYQQRLDDLIRAK